MAKIRKGHVRKTRKGAMAIRPHPMATQRKPRKPSLTLEGEEAKAALGQCGLGKPVMIHAHGVVEGGESHHEKPEYGPQHRATVRIHKITVAPAKEKKVRHV